MLTLPRNEDRDAVHLIDHDGLVILPGPRDHDIAAVLLSLSPQLHKVRKRPARRKTSGAGCKMMIGLENDSRWDSRSYGPPSFSSSVKTKRVGRRLKGTPSGAKARGCSPLHAFPLPNGAANLVGEKIEYHLLAGPIRTGTPARHKPTPPQLG